MKKLLLSLLLTLMSVSLYADTLTFQFYAISGDKDIISWSTDKNNGSTAPAINGTELRIYAKGSITINAKAGITIDKIIFTISNQGKKRLAPISASEGIVAPQTKGDETVTWTGNSSSVTFTVGDKAEYGSDGASKAGQLCISEVDIVYTTSGPILKEAKLSFPESNYQAELGQEFKTPVLSKETNAAVTYSSDDMSVATVDETTGDITLIAAGETTITATAPANDEYAAGTASYTLTVIDPSKVRYEDNLTIGLFKNISSSYIIDSYTSEDTRVKYTAKALKSSDGFQINTTAGATKNGNLSGIVSVLNPKELKIEKIVAKCTSNTAGNLLLKVSNTPGTAGADKSSGANNTVQGADDGKEITGNVIADKTEVTFAPAGDYMYFYLYTSGNTVISELDVYYKTPSDPTKQDVTLTFDGGDVTEEFAEGKTVQGRIATADVEGLTINYSSSNEAVATVDANGMLTFKGVGSTIITASTEATDDYNAAEASYTLTVEMVYKSIADVIKYAKDGNKLDLNFPMTVGYNNGSTCLVTDNIGGYIMIYGKTAYEVSDVIPAGMQVTYTLYGGLPELKPQTTPESTEKGEYVIETVSADEVMAQPLNKIVKVLNVKIDSATPGENASGAARNFTAKVGDTELKFFNDLKTPSVEAGVYNVTAAISTYNGNSTEVAEPNQLKPISFEAIPAAPVAEINSSTVTENYELQGEEVTIYLTAAEGATIWYRFTPDSNAAVNALAEEGFQKYTVDGIKIGKLGTLEYYTELNGVNSEIARIDFSGTPTSLLEIAVEGADAEWYDLAGRRVAAPAKGFYLKKTGSKVSKYVF